MVAGEVISAVCGVCVDRMSLEKVLGSYHVTSGAAESINLVENLPITETS